MFDPALGGFLRGGAGAHLELVAASASDDSLTNLIRQSWYVVVGENGKNASDVGQMQLCGARSQNTGGGGLSGLFDIQWKPLLVCGGGAGVSMFARSDGCDALQYNGTAEVVVSSVHSAECGQTSSSRDPISQSDLYAGYSYSQYHNLQIAFLFVVTIV
jgi:hypothetical protein